MRKWEGLWHHSGLRVYCERWVSDWSIHHYPTIYPGGAFASIHAYAQLVYAIEVKPNILETDPGPLDARVP